MDSTLVVCVFCVPGEEVLQELRERDWGWSVIWLGLGSPGILEIQGDPIFSPCEDNVGDTSGTTVKGGGTGAISSCSHLS